MVMTHEKWFNEKDGEQAFPLRAVTTWNGPPTKAIQPPEVLQTAGPIRWPRPKESKNFEKSCPLTDHSSHPDFASGPLPCALGSELITRPMRG